jgi:hypothetical protein
MSKEIKNLLGKRFGKLVVTNYVGIHHKKKKAMWLCKCDCGNTKITLGTYLSSKETQSCGCSRIKHGMSYTQTYRVWADMKNRCTNISSILYKYYGGRGIKVCDRWMYFKNFLEDMGESPPGLELNRIDNNGNYSPKNCKWSTKAEQ